MKKNIACIDIGSTKITSVIAQVEGGIAPKVIGVATMPSLGLKKGVVVNIDQATSSIATSLEAAERMAGVTMSSVYITINGKHITSTNNKGVVATSSQDEITIDDVFRAIDSARTVAIPPTREIIHVIPREFIVDMQNGIKDPIGMSGTRLEVDAHIISGVSSSIQNLTKCVESLGLKIDDVIFTGWASAISTLTDTEKQLGVLLLDIGGGTTSICSFSDESITYSGCIDFGGINITSDLAICLRITLEDAEKLKLNLGNILTSKKQQINQDNSTMSAWQRLRMPKKNEIVSTSQIDEDLIDISMLKISNLLKVSKRMIENIIEARMLEVFRICKDQIESAGFTTQMPAGVVVTGGSALIPGISNIAHNVFGVPARVAYPRGVGGMIDEINYPSFSAVQGLVLHISSDTKFEAKEVKTGQTLRGDGSKSANKSGVLSRFKGIFNKFGT